MSMIEEQNMYYLFDLFFNSYLTLDMKCRSICEKRLKEKIFNNRPPFHPYPS